MSKRIGYLSLISRCSCPCQEEKAIKLECEKNLFNFPGRFDKQMGWSPCIKPVVAEMNLDKPLSKASNGGF
jgi:hypothetical protein